MPCDDEQAASTSTAESIRKLDLPEGIPPLTSLYLYISGSCNLACRHCWITPTFQQENSNGKYLELTHIKKAIQQSRPLGLCSVKLTGGEPLLHPQFREIISLIAKEGLGITIETNGILADRELAQLLKARSPGAFISVSVDGAAAETHDNLRGVKGCFEQAISGIRNLVQSGFRPQLICTLHKGNMEQVEKVVELAEKLGCNSVKFNHVQKVGRGKQFDKKMLLHISEVIELYKNIERVLVEKYKIPIHFDIPFAFYSIRRLLQGHLSRCKVLNILGMLAGGELSLCGIGTTIPQLIYGHIEKEGLRWVWCEGPGLSNLREQIPEHLEGICEQCLHRDMCLGHCVANSFQANHKLNYPYYFCRQANKKDLFPESRKKIIP
jgi:SynChlorMet cassette radical SAM/SPASM protein ScmF